jgi:methylmalonyl-CoA/ethylmalonyl-CoA epimerase
MTSTNPDQRGTTMPNGPLAHICLLVEDLDQAVADWQKILAVLDPGQVSEPIVRYDDFTGGDDQMRWVTFVSGHGAEIQLCEPAADTPLGRRLAKRGEHVHHICFTTDDVPAAAQKLVADGIDADAEHTYSDPELPWQEWTWVLPSSAHGVLVEIAKPYRAASGKWESAA